MSELIKLLLPVMIQFLPLLFNKPKGEMVEWCERGANAALAAKQPMTAFWMGSFKCAFEGMTDQQYGDICIGINAAGDAAAKAVKGGAV